MKLNEKHLALFASSSIIDKQGYLNKKGEINKAFQRRWFALSGNLLFYYDKKYDPDPLGVIILEGYMVEMLESYDRYVFELVFPGVSSRTYVLAAESQEEMESWMKALTCASYDFMKSAIVELQNQLDSLISKEKGISLNFNTSSQDLEKSQKSENRSFNNKNLLESLEDGLKSFVDLHNDFGQNIMSVLKPQ